MKFREWWLTHCIEGYSLDKDILTDNKEYSPDNCLYVPKWLNSVVSDRKNHNNHLPIGVSIIDSSFTARIRHYNKPEYLGFFKTPEEAHQAWHKSKLEYLLERKPEMDKIDLRIYSGIINLLNRTIHSRNIENKKYHDKLKSQR